MMMTLRVVAMCRPRLPDALDTRIDLEDAGKLAEVTDLVRRLRDPRRQRGGLEAEVAEEVLEADRRRHLAVVDRAEPLGLPPARNQRLVAGLEPDLGRMGGEQRVQVAGRRAHSLAVDLDRRH